MQKTFNSVRDPPAGGLSRCLVEGETAATLRFGRGKAMLASMTLQGGLLALLVLAPLLATGELPRIVRLTPLSP